jgi:hypothetical protein
MNVEIETEAAQFQLFSLLLMFVKLVFLKTFFYVAFLITFSTDSKSAWNSAFFDIFFDFIWDLLKALKLNA